MSKWRPGHRRVRIRPLQPNVRKRIDDAAALIERKRYAEAFEILAPLAAKHPDRPEILASQAAELHEKSQVLM